MKISFKEGGRFLFGAAFEKIDSSFADIERISLWYEETYHAQAKSYRVIAQVYSYVRIIGEGTSELHVARTTKSGCESIIEGQRVVKSAFDCFLAAGYAGLITYRGMQRETLMQRARAYTASLRRQICTCIAQNKIPESIQLQRLLTEARMHYESAARKILTPEDAELFAIFFRTEIDLDHVAPLYQAGQDTEEIIRRSAIENIQALTKSAHKEKTKADKENDYLITV